MAPHIVALPLTRGVAAFPLNLGIRQQRTGVTQADGFFSLQLQPLFRRRVVVTDRSAFLRGPLCHSHLRVWRKLAQHTPGV